MTALLLLTCAAPCSAAAAPAAGTVPLLLDGERIYAALSFVRPDGTRHETQAFVDLGGPSMVVSPDLMRELHGRPGEVRHLVLARDHGTLRVDAPVTAF